MADVETSLSTGLQCRIDHIVIELRGYIASGVISMEEVASLLHVKDHIEPSDAQERSL
jgi:hypothetical protein